MSGNFAIKGGEGVGGLMANAILNFHFDYLSPPLSFAHFVFRIESRQLKSRSIGFSGVFWFYSGASLVMAVYAYLVRTFIFRNVYEGRMVGWHESPDSVVISE